jgi:tetrahydromethanopterin S-methyltransferase subunit D
MAGDDSGACLHGPPGHGVRTERIVEQSAAKGTFVGAFGGGLLYDALGSYTMAWRIGVALGLAGGIIQIAFALVRPSAPPMLKTA